MAYFWMFKYPWNWNTLRYTNIITIMKEDIYNRLIPLHALFIHSFSNTLSSVTYCCSFLVISYITLSPGKSLWRTSERDSESSAWGLRYSQGRGNQEGLLAFKEIQLNEERSSNANSIVMSIFLHLYPPFIYLFSSVHCPATKLLWLLKVWLNPMNNIYRFNIRKKQALNQDSTKQWPTI